MNMDASLYINELSQRLSLKALTYSDANNNGTKTGSRGDKYSLRPRSARRNRVDDEDVIPVPTKTKSRTSKPKQKPAPLSKYRRKTANARERTRMREINAAFEQLRQAVPHLQPPQPEMTAANEKLTKITTLRLAMKYISALSTALSDNSNSAQCNSYLPGASLELGDLISDCSDLDCLFLESDGESMNLQSDLSEHSLTPDTSDQCLTPVDLSAGFSVHFGDSLSPTFSDQTLSPFDSLFPDFS